MNKKLSESLGDIWGATEEPKTNKTNRDQAFSWMKASMKRQIEIQREAELFIRQIVDTALLEGSNEEHLLLAVFDRYFIDNPEYHPGEASIILECTDEEIQLLAVGDTEKLGFARMCDMYVAMKMNLTDYS